MAHIKKFNHDFPFTSRVTQKRGYDQVTAINKKKKRVRCTIVSITLTQTNHNGSDSLQH
jgi:hypothetical protein